MGQLTFRERIGQGGQGEVYAATLDDGVEVAVKRLHQAPDGDDVRRLIDEARLLEHARHPGIVKPIALVEIEGQIALLTELVRGANLAQILTTGHTPSGAIFAIGATIADILHEAFSTEGPNGALGLVHRDLRASNIILQPDGRPKLLDLGMAWSTAARPSGTASGQVVGSLETLAPESFVQAEPTAARDVFALAALLVLGLSNQSLYAGRTSRQIAQLCASSTTFDAYVREVLGRIPQGHHLRAALSYEPASRPSAQAFGESLSRAALQLPGPSATAWASAAIEALPAPEAGEWTGRTLPVKPAGFKRASPPVQARRTVGEADPTERFGASPPPASQDISGIETTVKQARALPSRSTAPAVVPSRRAAPPWAYVALGAATTLALCSAATACLWALWS